MTNPPLPKCEDRLSDEEESAVRRIVQAKLLIGRPLPLVSAYRKNGQSLTVKFGEEGEHIYKVNLDTEDAEKVAWV